MGEDNGVFLFLERVNRVDKRGIGGPFKFRDKVRDFVIKMVRRGFHLVSIVETTLRLTWDSADAILNFEGLANPAAIFPIDEFLTHIRAPPEV